MMVTERKRDVYAAVFGAVIGALITGVVSLSWGLYSMNKSMAFTVNKELINTIRWDISTLRQVDAELDSNLEILLSTNFSPELITKKLELVSDENKKDKELIDLLLTMQGKFVSIESYKFTNKELVEGVWKYGPLRTEIAFSLSSRITDFYRKIRKANVYVNELRYLLQRDLLSKASLARVNEMKHLISRLITEITKDRIIDLKNRIQVEVARLESMREEATGAMLTPI